MSKYRFKPAEKWAVWKTHGENCKWCNIPVYYPHCQIDHVLPESLPNKDLKVYNRLKKLYNLHTNFNVNSFYNWIPIHSGCNQSKSDDVFDGAPFVGQLLSRIEKKYAEAEHWYNSMKKNRKQAKIMATIAQAVEDEIIKESDLMKIFKNVKNPDKAVEQMTINAFKYGLPSFPEGRVQTFEINNVEDCTSVLTDYTTSLAKSFNEEEKENQFRIILPGDFPNQLTDSVIPQLQWLGKIVDAEDDDKDNNINII